MYNELAPFYDNAIRDRFSTLLASRLEGLLAELGHPPPDRVLDLGCGTGGLALALARAGYTVVGLDQSERMLDIARRRAAKQDLTLDLRLGDIRDFSFSERHDVALCTGDVVNHLLEPHELDQLFASVRDTLYPGGPFIFDVNTLAMYRSRLWHTEKSQVEAESFTMTTNARFDERSGIGRLDTTVIERTMMTERERRGALRQRLWPEDVLRAALAEAGFEVLAVEAFHPLEMPDELPELIAAKTLWTCRRG